MIDSLTFFIIWLTFTIIVICTITPFVIWAIRSGHFSNFDYASKLALKSRIIEDDTKEIDRKKNVSD